MNKEYTFISKGDVAQAVKFTQGMRIDTLHLH